MCVWLGHCKSFMASAPWPTTASPAATKSHELNAPAGRPADRSTAARLFTPTRDYMVVNISPPSKFKSRQHEQRDLRLQQAFLSISTWCRGGQFPTPDPSASSGQTRRTRRAPHAIMPRSSSRRCLLYS